MKRKSVYLLKAIHPEIHNDGRKGHYRKDDKNYFECWIENIGVFSTITKAEDVMKKLIREKDDENIRWKGWERYVGFIINELYLDDALYSDCYVSHFESRRSYLSDGTLNCISECDDRCEKKFNGTDHPNIHVKKGDIALELSGLSLVPVLVEETSMSKEEWANRVNPNTYGDCTDDSGLAFSAHSGHVHPFAPDLFPLSCLPYAKILKSDINKMKRMRKLYFEGKAL